MFRYLSPFFITLLFLQAADAPPKPVDQMLAFKISLTQQEMGYADLLDDSGKVGYRQRKITAGNTLLNLSYTNWQFMWQGMENSTFASGETRPIKEVHALNLSMRMPVVTETGQMVMTMLILNSVYEVEQSRSYGATGVIYRTNKKSDDVITTLGGIIYYHPVRTIILPIASYNYRMRARDGWKASVGFPTNYIGYHPSEKWMWLANISFNTATVRLREESPISPGGYLSLSDYLGGLGFRYFHNDCITLNASLNMTLYRDLLTYDSDGNELDGHPLQGSYGAQFSLEYIF